ncbi:MAG: hypothetical protein V1863_01800 [Candidatus Omnitrophota bacterium]
MVEEKKACCFCTGKPASIMKFLLGLIIVLAGVVWTVRYFEFLKVLIIGCLGPFLILVGLIAIAVSRE